MPNPKDTDGDIRAWLRAMRAFTDRPAPGLPRPATSEGLPVEGFRFQKDIGFGFANRPLSATLLRSAAEISIQQL